MVVNCLDRHSGERVAIKKVSPLTHPTFCQRTLREIKILSKLRHENIVQLRDLMVAPTVEAMNEVRQRCISGCLPQHCWPHGGVWPQVYLVLDLMETDLHRLLKSLRGRGEKLTATHTYAGSGDGPVALAQPWCGV
jgi:mitogen-activated protein kinase 1/3